MKFYTLLLIALLLSSCKPEGKAPREKPPSEPDVEAADVPEVASPVPSKLFKRHQDFVDEVCACPDRACQIAVGKRARAVIDKEATANLANEFPVEFAKLMARSRECRGKGEAPSAEAEATLDATEAAVANFVDQSCACPDLRCFDSLDGQFQDRIDPAGFRDFAQTRSGRAGELMARRNTCRDVLVPTSAAPVDNTN